MCSSFCPYFHSILSSANFSFLCFRAFSLLAIFAYFAQTFLPSFNIALFSFFIFFVQTFPFSRQFFRFFFSSNIFLFFEKFFILPLFIFPLKLFFSVIFPVPSPQRFPHYFSKFLLELFSLLAILLKHLFLHSIFPCSATFYISSRIFYLFFLAISTHISNHVELLICLPQFSSLLQLCLSFFEHRSLQHS